MADLMAIHGLAYPTFSPSTPSSDSTHKKRSRSVTPSKSVSRAKSSNALADMAAVASPLSMISLPDGQSEHSLSTLRDPRAASTSDLTNPATSSSSSSPRHPDLSNEVAALSDKLIQAINSQTHLDDTLAVTRQELDGSRARVRQLEEDAEKHKGDLASGILVRKDAVDHYMNTMREELDEEITKRITAEKEKKNIEQELENLTAALFEEANKMVAAAKKEREAVERRNDQLRQQIKDTEMLLASHQDQLAELKLVMQQMNSPRDDTDAPTNPSTSPSSPAIDQQQGNINRLLEAMNLSPVASGSGDISPGPSTSFSHLIKSVCRTDILAYDDFHTLLQLSRTSKAPSRVGSGSYGGLNVMGLANFTGGQQTPQKQQNGGHTPSNSGGGANSSVQYGASLSSRDSTQSNVQLKETRFYKRILTEDIEPTLRLDTAPGISWLTRRSVISSICDGGLVVEPMPTASIKYSLSCSMCGERRKGPENPRTHRFRTSDSENAQRHPLCVLCLEKMRSCCDFVGYLRLVVDGHVRIGDEEDEKEAWEETVRLRERMFWSRMGGGVIPTFLQTDRSVKDTSTSNPGSPRMIPPSEIIDGVVQTVDLSNGTQSIDVTNSSEDPFKSNAKRASIGKTIISTDGIADSPTAVDSDLKPREISPKPIVQVKMAQTVSGNSSPVAFTPSDANSQPNSVPPAVPSKNAPSLEPRLKVTIPAAFRF